LWVASQTVPLVGQQLTRASTPAAKSHHARAHDAFCLHYAIYSQFTRIDFSVDMPNLPSTVSDETTWLTSEDCTNTRRCGRATSRPHHHTSPSFFFDSYGITRHCERSEFVAGERAKRGNLPVEQVDRHGSASAVGGYPRPRDDEGALVKRPRVERFALPPTIHRTLATDHASLE
jgi:hypothetical protein